jgi:hypothetical protein
LSYGDFWDRKGDFWDRKGDFWDRKNAFSFYVAGCCQAP